MALKADIEAAIVPSDLNILYVMSQAERVRIIYDHLNIILTVIVFLSLLVLVVSALGMASATGISILSVPAKSVCCGRSAPPRNAYSRCSSPKA